MCGQCIDYYECTVMRRFGFCVTYGTRSVWTLGERTNLTNIRIRRPFLWDRTK